MITERVLNEVLEFWERNGYPNSIMESQRKYNAEAYELSKKSVLKLREAIENGKRQ